MNNAVGIFIRHIAALTIFKNPGIRFFNFLVAIQFNMPQAVLDGPLGASVTTTYSCRLNTSFTPRASYGRDLAAMQQPFLLVAGLDDEAFVAEQYESVISVHTDSGSYVLLPDTGHIDLLTSPELEQVLINWFADLMGKGDTPIAHFNF